MKNNLVKFGYKLWVAATPLKYAIQFYPYMGKDDIFDPDLGPGRSLIDKLIDSLQLLTCITDIIEKPPKYPCFQFQERKPKFLMKSGLTN